jgi:hypothetical protein
MTLVKRLAWMYLRVGSVLAAIVWGSFTYTLMARSTGESARRAAERCGQEFADLTRLACHWVKRAQRPRFPMISLAVLFLFGILPAAVVIYAVAVSARP